MAPLSLYPLVLLTMTIFSANGQTPCANHGDCGELEFCRVAGGGGECTTCGDCTFGCGECWELPSEEVMGRFCPACPNVHCESHDDCHCVDYCTNENWCNFSCDFCERDGFSLDGSCPPCPNLNGTCNQDLTGSCAGSCGGQTISEGGDCYCNAGCTGFADCCSDFSQECRSCQGHHECLQDQYCSKDLFCHHGIDDCAEGVTGNSVDGECPPNPNIHGLLTGSCEDSCGGQASDGDCFCNAQCELIGDCCQDIDEHCGHICQGHHECEETEYCTDQNICVEMCEQCEGGNSIDGECPPCPNTHGLLTGSCASGCGGKSDDGDCFCNVFCLAFGDCCRDYENFCHVCQSDDECPSNVCEENRFCRTAVAQEAINIENEDDGNELSTGAIVGIAVAVAVVATLLVGAAFSQLRKSRGRGEIAEDNQSSELDEVGAGATTNPVASSGSSQEGSFANEVR